MGLCTLLLTAWGALPAGGAAAQAAPLFQDDFESGTLRGWSFPWGAGHRLVDTGDVSRGHALELQVASRPVFALMRGSEGWGNVRIEGVVRFPEDVNNYLGFIYRYRDDGRRIDFGDVYIKGNGSYVRANPHYDTNVGRTLYEEFRTPLQGAAAIVVGEWKAFALEVVGSEAHLYVGEGRAPVVTFPFYAGDQGAFGFEPRNPGGAVWIDDVRVRAIEGFSWTGPPRPGVDYTPGALLTDWQVLGPLEAMQPGVEDGPYDAARVVEDDGRRVAWRPFPTDARGAVVTARVTEYRGGRRVAYFHTAIPASHDSTAELALSSVDDLAVWLDGRFLGFAAGQDAAWWDVGVDPDHPPIRASLSLHEGMNHLVIRVVGGSYASGGFFARLLPGSGPSG